MVTIWTHVNPDLDAVFSVLFVQMFLLPKGTENQLRFVPANWDGEGGKDGDWAVDIEAGGHGIKGVVDSDGTVHSCFASLLERFGNSFDKLALTPLSRFIDTEDSKGSAVKYLTRGISRENQIPLEHTGLNSVLAAVKATASKGHDRDENIVEKMRDIFLGMVLNARSRCKAEIEALQSKNIEWIGERKEVALMTNPGRSGMMYTLFNMGAKAVVYIDGNNIGVARDSATTQVPMDHLIVRSLVQRYGESDWFAHSSGFLFCRGSKKAPATTKSRVPAKELAEAVVQVLELENGPTA